jgi:hypothetical protein
MTKETKKQKRWTQASLLMACSLMAGMALAQKHNDKETQQDIQRHRAMAAAHEAAAQCLAAGKAHDVCQKALQAACKGLAIGTSCGMRHAH